MDREPEAWETNAAAPFLTIGEVSVRALGNDRFRIESPAGAEEVVGFDEAQRRADGAGQGRLSGLMPAAVLM
jgi:hypothetical protein